MLINFYLNWFNYGVIFIGDGFMFIKLVNGEIL